MAVGRTTSVKVNFEVAGDGQVKAAFLATEDGAKRGAKSLDDFGAAASRTEASQTKLLGAARLAGAALGGALVTGLGLVVRNTMQAQQEQAQLEAVLRSTGNAAGYSAEQLNAMAQAMSEKSLLSAGEITEAQTRLLSYSGIVGEKFPQALQVAIDQAQRLGISVTQSAEIVGRALESPTKAAAALAQQGFGAAFTDAVKKSIETLEDAGREAEAQQIIIDILNESYGDAAIAARDTFGGSLIALKNVITDLLTGGDGDLDGLQGAVDELVLTLGSAETREAFSSMIGGLGDLAGFAISAARELGNVGDVIDGIQKQADAAGRMLNAAAGFDSARLKQASDDYMAASAQIDKATGTFRNVRSASSDFVGTFDNVVSSVSRPDAAKKPDPEDAAKAAAKAAAEARRAEAAAAREAAAAERELEKAQRDAAAAAAAFTAEQDAALRTLEDLRAEMAGPAAEVMLQFARLERDLDMAVAAGALTWEQYAEAMELVHQKREKALADIGTDLAESTDAMTAYADQAARNMQTAFADFLFDPFDEGLSGMLQSFAETLQRMYAEYLSSQLFQAIMGGGTDSTGNMVGGILDLFTGSGFGFAKGGALPASPSLSAYSGSVVSQPTPFYFAKGGALGVMGEVPGESEGIFPLKRGRDGKLGVAAEISGAGGGVVVEINNYSDKEARTESGKTPDGRDLIRVFIGEAAKDLANGGQLARAGEGAYGWNRRGVSNG